MKHAIIIDIETIGTSRKDVIDFIAGNTKPPATYKKAETIAAWYKDTTDAKTGEVTPSLHSEAVAEAVAKTGLDGAFGQIVCIGYQAPGMDAPATIHGLDEADVLNKFNAVIHEELLPKDWLATTLVGHNASGFDARFLMQRFIVNSIRPHGWLKRAADAKPWESEKVFDTMIQFAGHGNRISLDKLCLALSIPSPKGEMDGSKVSQYVADGRLEEVAAYCKRDVTATKAVFERMTFA